MVRHDDDVFEYLYMRIENKLERGDDLFEKEMKGIGTFYDHFGEGLDQGVRMKTGTSMDYEIMERKEDV